MYLHNRSKFGTRGLKKYNNLEIQVQRVSIMDSKISHNFCSKLE